MTLSCECPICLEDICALETRVSLPGCNHIMHKSCFVEFLTYNVGKANRTQTITCPMCRKCLVEVQREHVVEQEIANENINNNNNNDHVMTIESDEYMPYANANLDPTTQRNIERLLKLLIVTCTTATFYMIASSLFAAARGS